MNHQTINKNNCLKNLSELQQNTVRQLSEIRKIIHVQKENINQEMKTFKEKKQKDILELRSKIAKLKNLIESFNSTASQTGKIIMELTNKLLEIIQLGEQQQ